MEILTAEQFKQRYGTTAPSFFQEDKKKEGLFTEIKQAFQQGLQKVGSGIEEGRPTNAQGNLIKGVGQIVGGATEAVSAPLAPLFSRTIGKAIDYVGSKIGSIPAVQKFAQTSAGEKTADIASTVADYANAAGLVAGGVGGTKVARSIPGNLPKVELSAAGIPERVSGAVRDVVPTTQGLIDHNLARALDLTPGDLRNIAASTGNEVGPWMANFNLIGNNKTSTLALVNKFFTDNYQTVRSEIGKVPTLYRQDQVPYYTDALKAIAAETEGKLGLETVNAELAGLLQKAEITLTDVQRVKELIDSHFNLYKVTGDVQTGVAKQGLSKVREDIKSFIENEVQQNTGADIRQLNNNVSTARSLIDAIEARTPRGLTRAQLTWRDAAIGMGLTYFGSPLAGIAAVAVWKILTSPSIRLRFARWLDGLNDAQRLKASEAIRDNKLTSEMKKILEVKN